MELNPIYLRLKQAIDWLKFNRHMMKQDIAAKMGMTGVSFSRGLARCKEKNDEDFVIKFHRATGEIFSLDWLLHGTGEKFTADSKNAEPDPVIPTYAIDSSSAVNAALAAYAELTNRLKQEMADRIADKDTIIAEKQSRIESLERTIANLERTVADKDALIRARDSCILELERRIAQSNADDLSKYPFAIGAAEDQSRQQQTK